MVMAIVSVLACDKGDPMGEFEVLTDRMCECKTRACVDKVNEQHRKWQEKYADSEMHTLAERERAGEVAGRMIDCEEKVTGGSQAQ